jgi:hypothetical protein
MQLGTDNALRTRVYIDGYNLYYGCLKHSADKWLDVRTLVERILPSILFEKSLAFEMRSDSGTSNRRVELQLIPDMPRYTGAWKSLSMNPWPRCSVPASQLRGSARS